MANSGLIVVGLLAAGGIGYYLYTQSQNAAAPSPSPASNPPTGLPSENRGYTIPSDLYGAMQGAWVTAGRPTSSGAWISTMQGVVPASGAAWQYVFNDWAAIYNTTTAWPSNSQLQGWLTAAIQNYG